MRDRKQSISVSFKGSTLVRIDHHLGANSSLSGLVEQLVLEGLDRLEQGIAFAPRTDLAADVLGFEDGAEGD